MDNSSPQLLRSLTLLDGISCIVSMIIGTGVFASPGVIVSQVNQVGISLLVWILGGILSMLGGLCFAELGSSMPKTGGDYAYLAHLHQSFGFSFIWACFLCIKTGSLAIISIIFARYFGSLILVDLNITDDIDSDYRIKLLAIASLISVTGLNIIGIEWVAKIQTIFFWSKLIAIIFVCIMGLYSISFGNTLYIAKINLENIFYIPPLSLWSISNIFFYSTNIGSGIIASLWAYDGFNTLNMVAGELLQPQKNIPLAIVSAMTIVIICYVCVNIAYFLVLPLDIVMTSKAVAVTVSESVWGTWASIITALLVSFSALGTLNTSTMTGARVFYAGASDKIIPFHSYLSRVSKDFGTPYVAVLAQNTLAIIFIIPGNFEVLVNYFGFVAWIFYGLCGFCVIWFRIQAKKQNQVSSSSSPLEIPSEETFKVTPYPFIPILFICCALGVLFSSFIASFIPTLIATICLLAGLPIYFSLYWKGNMFKKLYNKIINYKNKNTMNNTIEYNE